MLRLAGSLIQHRLLLRLDDGRYQLGSATFMLGALYQRSLNLGDILVPLMRELAETSGESVSFYVRDEAVRVCLHRVDSTHAVRFHVREGDVLPLESGSGGLALLAFGGKPGEILRANSRRLLLCVDRRARPGDGRRFNAGIRRAPEPCVAY